MKEATLEKPSQTNIVWKKAKSYFEQRMDLLGITAKNNSIKLWENINENNEHKDVLVNRPVFRELPEGIEIIVYTLDRQTIRIQKNGSRMKKSFSIIRLENPQIKPDGSLMKYRLPKGAGTHPFFPPPLIEKFEKKETIETLILTEGYFKAFKGSLHGLDIIGLSSITHMKNQETGKLHPDIIRLMNICKVKKIVWLTDGDALDITQQEISAAADLTRRPKNFFNSVTTFKNLLDDFEAIEKWYFYIDTDNILSQNAGKVKREDVKGLDDLLIFLPEKNNEIITDLKSVNSGFYFQKFNITYGTGKVYNHFHLRDVNDFYLFHVERRPELKEAEFIYNGTTYKYNDEFGQCDVKIPGNAKLYFRVGDNYFKFFNKPNQKGEKELCFEQRQKSTIKDDHGPNIQKHIPKYEAFCNVPDNQHFQQVIGNCFNVYSPLDFFPDDEDCGPDDCPKTMEFLYHIFSEKRVSYFESGIKKEYKSLDLALDYLQILYLNPCQKLPILCLVGKENNTGKSSFGHFLRILFGANVAIVGNADLQNDFNAHWATKSVVICDETKIDKDHVVEKIKALSTAPKIFMNAKGRGQVELDCFIKFILITNNENTFIKITEEDIRYWVIKVPILKALDPEMLNYMRKEIPFFLSYLQKRKLITEKKNRMWFHPELLKTEALGKLVAYSEPGLTKELRFFFKELFLKMPGINEIKMSSKNIREVANLSETKYSKPYLEDVLKENLKLKIPKKYFFEGDNRKYNTKNDAIAAGKRKWPDIDEEEIEKLIITRNRGNSYFYPTGRIDDNGIIINEKDNGKAFIIKRSDFVMEEEEEIVVKDEEEERENEKEVGLPF